MSVRSLSGQPQSVSKGSMRLTEGAFVSATVLDERFLECADLPSTSTGRNTPSFFARSALLRWMPFRIACCLSFPCFVRSLNSSGCETDTNAYITTGRRMRLARTGSMFCLASLSIVLSECARTRIADKPEDADAEAIPATCSSAEQQQGSSLVIPRSTEHGLFVS